MPQKIEPATHNQASTAVSHDLPYFFPMPGAITMNPAMFAGGLVRQRALQSAADGIMQKLPAFGAQLYRLAEAGNLQPRNTWIKRRRIRVPVPGTEDRCEPDQYR